VSNLASKCTGSTKFTACIVYTTIIIVCWPFLTYYTGKIFGSHAF